MTTTQDVLVTCQGGLTHIRFNRPAKRNAITVAMYAAMADALAAAESDGTVAVLFSGAGAGFCAGNDLADFLANRPENGEAPVHRFLRAIARSSRVLIAAVHGNAVGVGTTLLLHCDFVVAAQDSVLHMPFTDLALVPEAASSLLLPRLVGHQRAAALLMLGEKLSAAGAETLGLVNAVVETGQALVAAEGLAARVLAKPHGAILATKRLMKSTTTDVAARMDEETEAFTAGLKSAEFAATVEKFFATRGKAA